MPSDKYNSIKAEAMGLIIHYSTLLQLDRYLLACCSMYNVCFMDLPVSFFVFDTYYYNCTEIGHSLQLDNNNSYDCRSVHDTNSTWLKIIMND